MKNRYKNIILSISIIWNIVSSIIIYREFILITEMATIIKESGLLDSYSENKDNKELTQDEYIKSLENMVLSMVPLEICIINESYENYRKQSSKIMKQINYLITLSKDEKIITELKSIKKVVGGSPKMGDIERSTRGLQNYLGSYNQKLRNKKREDFYKGKL